MITQFQLDKAAEPEPERPRRFVKRHACLVVVDEEGKFVSATGSYRVDVQVVRKGGKRPTLLRYHNYRIALTRPEVVDATDFAPKPKRKGKKARTYVQVDGWMLKKFGIETKVNTTQTPHYRLIFPPHILESHRKYTPEQEVQMNELLLQGAVWYEWNDRHFLAVPPPE